MCSSDLEGDASANNRKAKIIVFYEWDVSLKWKGTVKGSNQSIGGSIAVPNLSDENTIDDLDVSNLILFLCIVIGPSKKFPDVNVTDPDYPGEDQQ